MRTLIVILFFVVVVAQAHAETLLGRAIWIHDGDTVTINAKNGTWFKVRLWGIDAPELDQPGGKEAMLELIQLIARKTVTVSVKDRDRYGRIVGVITYRNRDINREMIQRGHAWYYKQYAPDQKSYADAEQAAKEKKAGLWKSENPPIPPWDWRKRKRKKRAPRVERPEVSQLFRAASIAATIFWKSSSRRIGISRRPDLYAATSGTEHPSSAAVA